MAELDAMKELVAQLKAGAAGAGPGASMKGAGEWSCACCRGSLDHEISILVVVISDEESARMIAELQAKLAMKQDEIGGGGQTNKDEEVRQQQQREEYGRRGISLGMCFAGPIVTVGPISCGLTLVCGSLLLQLRLRRRRIRTRTSSTWTRTPSAPTDSCLF
jgi:hypothetical protein